MPFTILDCMGAGLLNCWNCHVKEQRFGCSSCKIARYCSEICQKEHWKLLHKSHCKYLSGKKQHRSSKHSQETCRMCKNELGKACWIQCYDRDLEVFSKCWMSIAKTKNSLDWKIANLPFQLGEISGNYFDFLDKLLSYLQSLLNLLLTKYPEFGDLLELFQSVTSYRAAHWTMAMIYGVTRERIERTLEFIQRDQCEDTKLVLKLFKEVKKVESQEGVSAWHSFMFLYEILGIHSFANILSSVDVDSFNEQDKKLAMDEDKWNIAVRKEKLYLKIIHNKKASSYWESMTTWIKSGINMLKMSDESLSDEITDECVPIVVVENKEYNLKNEPLVNHMDVLVKSFETLEIFNFNFQLKEFKEIYEQFSPIGVKGEGLYSCEVCKRQVNSEKCKYVYHTYYPHLEPLLGELEEAAIVAISMENHLNQIEDVKAYITYTTGCGLKVICNEDGCKGIYRSHVARYRERIKLNISVLYSKYRTKFCLLQCWVCKIHSGESHRYRTCKSRLYCSRECQTKDWKLHETICEQLKKAGDQVKSESQVRRDEGRTREEQTFEDGVKGHENCNDKDCEVVHHIKSLYGKLKPEEAEVD